MRWIFHGGFLGVGCGVWIGFGVYGVGFWQAWLTFDSLGIGLRVSTIGDDFSGTRKPNIQFDLILRRALVWFGGSDSLRIPAYLVLYDSG